MLLKLKDPEIFYPEYSTTKKKVPAAERVAVRWHYLTYGEFAEFVLDDGTLNVTRAVREMIDGIENLEVEIAGKARKIKTGADLMGQPVPYKLASEITEFLRERISPEINPI